MYMHSRCSLSAKGGYLVRKSPSPDASLEGTQCVAFRQALAPGGNNDFRTSLTELNRMKQGGQQKRPIPREGPWWGVAPKFRIKAPDDLSVWCDVET